MKLVFYKFQGTGNDFVMVDNREESFHPDIPTIQKLCERRFGIGSDGLILLSVKEDYDFEMSYYNADGTAAFCGNGARCAVQFSNILGIRKDDYHFYAIDGEHHASITEDNWVNLKMKDVNGMKKMLNDLLINTGVPHYVKLVDSVKDIDVYKEGKKIRNSPDFIREGVNVDFVQVTGDSSIYVRTYERGVEGETLSCGTGVTAAALTVAHNDRGFNRVEVETKGGHLAVEFNKVDDDKFQDIWLCGPATFVYKGEIEIPAAGENPTDVTSNIY